MKRETLLNTFSKRPQRFQLLDEAAVRAGWIGRNMCLLEIGCAGGGAAIHMAQNQGIHVTAVDQNQELIAQASAQSARSEHNCAFVCADACALPFQEASFDGIYSEAAFSVISDQEAAVSEYSRVLKPGGRILLNDFTLRTDYSGSRKDLEGIACLKNVQTAEAYKARFQRHGFACIYEREHYAEFLRIILNAANAYQVDPRYIGEYLLGAFCEGDAQSTGSALFSTARMSYHQLIFEKTDREITYETKGFAL